MVKMKLGNPKNAFWEALLLAGIMFVLGLLLGVSFEARKLDDINQYYAKSEIFLMDIFVFNNINDFGNLSCEKLIDSNIKFADTIYDEALLLEKYEQSGKISESMKLAHRKYDLLRTFLWTNTVKIKDKCESNFSYIVYLYEYDPDDLVKKATQRVWSEILFQLKQEKGNGVVLIPIAVNSNLTSLDYFIEKYEISDSPALIIDGRETVYKLDSVNQLKDYLY